MTDLRHTNLTNVLRHTILKLSEEIAAHLDPQDPGPGTGDPTEIARYWTRRYFRHLGYARYPAARAARPPLAKLGQRGWGRKWRAPSMVDPTRRPPMPKEDPLARDPIARVVRGADVEETLVKTPQQLLEAAERARRGDPALESPPADSEELRRHLAKIAPALQSRVLYRDERSVRYFISAYDTIPRDPRKYSRYGHARTEYWENTRTGGGLWVFAVARSGRRHSEARVVREVWRAVKVLERLFEHDGEPFMHGLLEGEDRRLRDAVEDLIFAQRQIELLDREDAEG